MFYYLSHSTSPIFVLGFFQDRVLTICPGWLQTAVLLISASQVASITDVSHLAPSLFIYLFISLFAVLGFELSWQAFYHLSHTSSPGVNLNGALVLGRRPLVERGRSAELMGSTGSQPQRPDWRSSRTLG
jgi:hypothetical protein